MKHTIHELQQSQIINTVGQNNSISLTLLKGLSLQEMLESSSYAPGVDPENGRNAFLIRLNGKVTVDTDHTVPMIGKILLIAADGFTQTTNAVHDSEEALIDSVFNGRVDSIQIGKMNPFKGDGVPSGRNWIQGSFLWQPSKKAIARGWNTSLPFISKKLYIAMVLIFNQPGLGQGRSLQVVTEWQLTYDVRRQTSGLK